MSSTSPNRNPSPVHDVVFNRPELGVVEATGEDVPTPVNTFAATGFGEILNTKTNISRCGYVKPTPFQPHTIQTSPPAATTAFPTTLIISPMTQSTAKVHEEAEKFAYQTGAKVTVANDGVPSVQMGEQVAKGTTTLTLMSTTAITSTVDSRRMREELLGLVLESDADAKFYTISKKSNLHCTSWGVISLWEDLIGYVKMQVETKEDFDPDTTTTATDATTMVYEYLDIKRQENAVCVDHELYGTDLISWPIDKEMEVVSITICQGFGHVRQLQRPTFAVERREYYKSYSTLGTGSSYVEAVMWGYYPDINDDDACELGLECMFNSATRDEFTGGPIHGYQIGCGTFVEKFCYTALEIQAKFLGTRYDRLNRSFFLIQPKSTPITEPMPLDFLDRNWEHGSSISDVQLVTKKKDIHVFKVTLAKEEDVARVKIPGSLVLADPVGTCYVPMTSKSVLYLLDFMEEEDGSSRLVNYYESREKNECSISRERHKNPAVSQAPERN